MNILFLSFNDCENDGRSRDLLNVAYKIGTVYTICLGKESKKDRRGLVFSTVGVVKSILYIKFFLSSFKKIIMDKQIDCIFIDNYHAALPGLLAKLFHRTRYIIQDSRELYTYASLPSLAGKFLIYCEHQLMKKADVVICANKYRSYICKGLYNLSQMPLTYENMHWIEEYNDIKSLNNDIKIISTDGLMVNRNLHDFLVSKKNLAENIKYYLLGDYTEKEYEYAQSLIKKHELKNIFIEQRLPRSELGNFLKTCHIGIVKYNFNDMNNIFCASGKIYEFIMMGIPVVTTEQFELKEICENYGVGVADNNFANGINKILDNYGYYVDNVVKFQEIIKNNNTSAILCKNICQMLDK